METPALIETFGGANLVAWNGVVWLVPQRLGPLDVDNPEHRARPGIESFPSVEAARSAARMPPPPSFLTPGAIRCTWWERTERMTDFIDHISSPIYRSAETGQEISGRDLPVGALYAATRREGLGPDDYPPVGPDGISVVCVLPGGHHWYIDGRASNCTMKDDKRHRCWVRHGTFGGRLHVDKNGLTCQAGGGSIAIDGWHGFLHNGELHT